MIGREHYFFENSNNLTENETLSEFIKQYYINRIDLPSKIMLPQKIDDIVLIEELLSNKVERRVELKTPQKGEKLRFIEMANNNAKITLENRSKEKEDIVLLLKEALNLLTEKERKVIELYYYEELTLKEISVVLEVSESRVSQLHTRALQKMKDKMGKYMGIFA